MFVFSYISFKSFTQNAERRHSLLCCCWLRWAAVSNIKIETGTINLV